LPGRIPAQKTARPWSNSSTSCDGAGLPRQPIPDKLQGKSLKSLLAGKVQRHRDAVFAEYAENEEAMLRTERWHFIYGTGKRLRQDGYATGKPLPGRTIQLYDVVNDPDEFSNLAKRPEHAKRGTIHARVGRASKTDGAATELIPRSEDVHAVLEHCLQPRDVETAKKKLPKS